MVQTIGRASALAIVGLFVLNVVLGLVQAMMPHASGRGETLRAGTVGSSSPMGGGAVIDLGQALSTEVKFFSDRILLDVEVKQLIRARKEVRLEVVVTPRPVEGYAALRMDRLAVDAAKTAIVTPDGTWLQVRDAHGIGLLYANEVRRGSPVYAIGVPRRADLLFPAPVSSAGRVMLLVRWAPGRTGTYADNWRSDRIVEVDLPLSQ